MTPEQGIQEYEEALNGIADRLNRALIELLGENAEWSNNVGSVSVPTEFGTQPDWVKKVWLAREEANSVLNWVQSASVEETEQEALLA